VKNVYWAGAVWPELGAVPLCAGHGLGLAVAELPLLALPLPELPLPEPALPLGLGVALLVAAWVTIAPPAMPPSSSPDAVTIIAVLRLRPMKPPARGGSASAGGGGGGTNAVPSWSSSMSDFSEVLSDA
jgi:hypothetical protein